MSETTRENAPSDNRPEPCPAHPNPGLPIFSPEYVDRCRPDCWTRIPHRDLRGDGKPPPLIEENETLRAQRDALVAYLGGVRARAVLRAAEVSEDVAR